MPVVNVATIQGALAPLLGLPLRRIGRAADLLWAHFGELHEVSAHGGGTQQVGDWALHLQCPWRITHLSTIVIALGDCYRAAEGDARYDWDAGGESRFDRNAEPLNRHCESALPLVRSIVTDAVGGFSLRLDGDYSLDVFPDDSAGSHIEQWRFFHARSGKNHLVFTPA